jgi:hypothetical protein
MISTKMRVQRYETLYENEQKKLHEFITWQDLILWACPNLYNPLA